MWSPLCWNHSCHIFEYTTNIHRIRMHMIQKAHMFLDGVLARTTRVWTVSTVIPPVGLAKFGVENGRYQTAGSRLIWFRISLSDASVPCNTKRDCLSAQIKWSEDSIDSAGTMIITHSRTNGRDCVLKNNAINAFVSCTHVDCNIIELSLGRARFGVERSN